MHINTGQGHWPHATNGCHLPTTFESSAQRLAADAFKISSSVCCSGCHRTPIIGAVSKHHAISIRGTKPTRLIIGCRAKPSSKNNRSYLFGIVGARRHPSFTSMIPFAQCPFNGPPGDSISREVISQIRDSQSVIEGWGDLLWPCRGGGFPCVRACVRASCVETTPFL